MFVCFSALVADAIGKQDSRVSCSCVQATDAKGSAPGDAEAAEVAAFAERVNDAMADSGGFTARAAAAALLERLLAALPHRALDPQLLTSLLQLEPAVLGVFPRSCFLWLALNPPLLIRAPHSAGRIVPSAAVPDRHSHR